MKHLPILAILLAVFVPLGFASYSVTGVARDGHGNTIDGTTTNIYVQFDLMGCNGNPPRVSGTVVDQHPKFTFDASGNILNEDGSAATIAGNNEISCPSGSFPTQWSVTWFLNNAAMGPAQRYTITGAFNLNTAIPNTTNPVVNPPTGDSTYARLDNGNTAGWGLAAKTVSTSTMINVQKNSYGYSLVADGTTDNCSAITSLLAAVPAYSTLYFPYSASMYHVAPSCAGGFGIVVGKDGISFQGDVSPWFDGTTMYGSVVDVPINFNSHKGNSVHHMATDCRVLGATSPCDGVLTGAAITTAGGATIDDYAYVGTRLTNPAHAVVVQSGPDNRIANVKAYSVFHAVAVRSPRTVVSNIHATDAFDIVVKSDVGSGSVYSVDLSNLICDSSVLFTNKACQVLVTSNDASVVTYNVNISNVSFNDAPYNFVVNAENGGVVENITATNISGFQSTATPIYTYTTTSGTCNQINISNSNFLNANTPAFLNSLGCTNMNPHGVKVNGVLLDDYQTYTMPNAKEGLVFLPAADGHESEIELVGRNFAANVNWWSITKGGDSVFHGVNGIRFADQGTGSELGAKVTSAFTGCSASVPCEAILPPGAYAQTTAAVIPVGSKLKCETGAVITVNAAITAFTLGSTATVSTYSPNQTEIEGCRFKTSTAGATAISVAEFVTQASVYNNRFIDWCPTVTGWMISLAGQNWDSRVSRNYAWATTSTPCTNNGIQVLAADPANGANGDFGASQPVIIDNHIQNSSSHTVGIGIQLNGAVSYVAFNSVAGYMPNIAIGAYANQSTVAFNRLEQPFTSFTGACIEYGDYSGSRVGAFLDGLLILNNSCNVHNRDLTTSSHFMGPATGTAGLQNSQINNNRVGSASATEPMVIQNNLGSQTGNVANGNELNVSGTAFTAIASTQIHTAGASITAWGGTDGHSFSTTHASLDLASVASGACTAETTETITGVAFGDHCTVDAGTALTAGTFEICKVTSANTVKWQHCNLSGGADDRASDTYTIRVTR